MKKLMLMLLAVVLLLPSVAVADLAVLSDEEMDGIHAAGLNVYIDISLFLAGDIVESVLEGVGDLQVLHIAVTGVNNTQTVGEGNSGNVLQNSVLLNGNAQQNLSALININAANSVIPIGINITVINGDNLGSVFQDNVSLGFMNSSLILGF